MRTFTTKDKEAIAVAFQGFMKVMDGKTRKVSPLVPLVEKALAEGINLDELFNKENYARAGSVIPSPDAEQYVDILINQKICPKNITDEVEWNEKENMTVLANCFHDFFVTINKKGGTFTTSNAMMNLSQAIMMFGIQPIMSEELINESMKDGECTCYQYILQILRYVIKPERELSKEQIERMDRNMINDLVNENEEENDEEFNNLEETEKTELSTSADKKDDDKDFSDEDDNDDPFFFEKDEDTHVGIINPAEMKKARIAEAIKMQSLEGICELAKAIDFEQNNNDDQPATIEDVINALTKGAINIEKESPLAKETHANINYELTDGYVICARMLGIDVDAESSFLHDLVMEDWDIRDNNLRKLYKVKDAMYKYMEAQGVDHDLYEAIKDIEKLYSSRD